MAPTVADMTTSLEDARFFYQQMDPIVRGVEQRQNLEVIRRYFRAYLHCWKCVVYFVREAKGLDSKTWIPWANRWLSTLDQNDRDAYDCLRTTRDHDTHHGRIDVGGEIAMGLYPIVMFVSPKGERRELISCCARGLLVAEHLVREHSKIV